MLCKTLTVKLGIEHIILCKISVCLCFIFKLTGRSSSFRFRELAIIRQFKTLVLGIGEGRKRKKELAELAGMSATGNAFRRMISPYT
jgi:hypothetical protein